MSEEQVIKQDTLFVGLTRVPTVLGIPYLAFVAEVMVMSLVNIVFGNPLYLLLVVPVHAILYMISAHDPGVFAEIAAWTKTLGRSRNGSFWNAASFSPLKMRKW